MVGLCRTEADKIWRSEIKRPRVLEGHLRINTEDADGIFTGVFTDTAGKDEEVRGRCSGTKIYFLRPADVPAFYYEGSFLSDDHIMGTQTPLPVSIAKGILASEEWEGTKVNTFESSSA